MNQQCVVGIEPGRTECSERVLVFVSGYMFRTNEDPEQRRDGAGDPLLELQVLSSQVLYVLVSVMSQGSVGVGLACTIIQSRPLKFSHVLPMLVRPFV